MDQENKHPIFVAKFLEETFNGTWSYKETNKGQLPEHSNIKPVQGFTPLTQFNDPIWLHFYKKFTFKPLQEKTTIRPFHDQSTFKPFQQRTTVKPHIRTFRPFHEKTTATVPYYERPFRETSTIAPLIIQSGHSSGLDNCLWGVALGGIGLIILMAICMIFGTPSRGVRRQLSNPRPGPDLMTITLNSYNGNSDMGSLLRLSECTASFEAAPPYSDAPPPYAAVTRGHTDTARGTDDPPPRYSATFEPYSSQKDIEPQVHIRHNNGLIEDGVRIEFVVETSN